jgi:hypothetical protein
MASTESASLPHGANEFNSSVQAYACRKSGTTLWIVLALCMLSVNTGCIAFMANMVRVIKGNDAPAEFDELKEKRVAVIASTPAGLNADASGIIIASHVHTLIATNVKKVQMVNQEEVSRIISDQPASQREMSVLGSRLGADFLVLVNLDNLRLREGQTLYKGSSNMSVTVYNIEKGSSPVFRKSFPEVIYPQTGMPVTDVDEATFQRFYLAEVASRAARIFYPYDPSVDFAKDAAVASLQSMR